MGLLTYLDVQKRFSSWQEMYLVFRSLKSQKYGLEILECGNFSM